MPTPAELDALYARYSYDSRDLETVPDFVASILAGVIASFEPYRRTGRFLDVGFGAGSLLRAAKAGGWETHGIEFSRLAVEQARANGFEHAIEGDFLNAPYSAGHFDVVAMDGVIEHLTNPAAFMRHAQLLLRPGGLLYITAPHGSGLSRRLLGAAWSVCAPPEHLHLFSRRSARRALRAAGFTDIDLSTRGVNPYEILNHVRGRVRAAPSGAHSFDRVESSYRLNGALVGNPAGRVFKQLVNGVLSATGLGDQLVARATKSGAR